MTYVCDLGTGQKIYLDNQGTQTIVTVVSQSSGQQQQASNGFQSGIWTSPPQVYRTANGVVIEVSTEQGERYIQIQGNSMNVTNSQPSLEHAQGLQLQQAESTPSSSIPPMEPMKPMKPMEPMKPMKMGDMEMKMNPMEMRMGNMEMRMGSPISPTRRFCSQCGAKIEANARFCSSCGYALS